MIAKVEVVQRFSDFREYAVTASYLCGILKTATIDKQFLPKKLYNNYYKIVVEIGNCHFEHLRSNFLETHLSVRY